jgi:DNA repair photolyase
MDHAVFESNNLTFITGGHCRFWSVNPYKLCDFRCTYCITGVQGRSAPALASKNDAMSCLDRALDKIPGDLPLVIGGISDAYPLAESELEITRDILKLLIARKRKFSIVTKSTLVERDADLFEDYEGAKVEFSFSTLEDNIASLYELDAPTPSSHMALLNNFFARGVNVKVALRPWIPQISDIQTFLDATPDAVDTGLERLKTVRESQTFSIAGRTFTQAQIDTQYLRTRDNFPECKRLKWSMDGRFFSRKVYPGLRLNRC